MSASHDAHTFLNLCSPFYVILLVRFPKEYVDWPIREFHKFTDKALSKICAHTMGKVEQLFPYLVCTWCLFLLFFKAIHRLKLLDIFFSYDFNFFI